MMEVKMSNSEPYYEAVDVTLETKVNGEQSKNLDDIFLDFEQNFENENCFFVQYNTDEVLIGEFENLQKKENLLELRIFNQEKELYIFRNNLAEPFRYRFLKEEPSVNESEVFKIEVDSYLLGTIKGKYEKLLICNYYKSDDEGDIYLYDARFKKLK